MTQTMIASTSSEASITLYIEVDDADDYFEERLYSDSWDAASDANKRKALLMAQKKIDRLPFKGRKYETTDDGQEEEWPRVIDESIVDWDSDLSATAIPQAVQDAVCEEALALLEAGARTSSPRATAQREGVASMRLADGTAETYDLNRSGGRKGLLSQEAYDLLRPFMATSVPVR